MQKNPDSVDTQSADGKEKQKKATNRDVAKLAGVSIATVSYVINGKENQHISETTKKKVYQAINFLNYAPNPYAVGLNTKQLHSIVIRTSKNACTFTEYEILHFMRIFNPICEEYGYQLSYSSDKRAVQIAASACLCFDMPNEEFYMLSDENYIPVIAVDGLVNDPIFYQVTVNFDKMKKEAEARFKGEEFAFAYIKPLNKAVCDKITAIFKKVIFVSSAGELSEVLKEKNVLVCQQTLFNMLDSVKSLNLYFYDSHIPVRGKVIMDCIFKAIDRLNVLDEEHYLTV